MSASGRSTRRSIDVPQAVAGVVSLAFVLAVSVALVRSAPDVEAEPLPPGMHAASPEPFRVPMAGRSDAVVTREVRFTVADGARLARQDELHFVIGTYDARPRIVRGTLRLGGSDCLFETAPGRIAQNRPRPFRRAQPCAATDGETGATLTVELRAATQRQGQLALWVVRLPDGLADAEAAPLLRIAADGHAFAPAGSRLRTRSAVAVPRIELLAFMWERPVWHLWLLLGLAWLALVHSAVALATRDVPPGRRWRPPRRSGRRASTSTASPSGSRSSSGHPTWRSLTSGRGIPARSSARTSPGGRRSRRRTGSSSDVSPAIARRTRSGPSGC